MKLRMWLCLEHKRRVLTWVNTQSGVIAETEADPSVQLCEERDCIERVDYEVTLRLNT